MLHAIREKEKPYTADQEDPEVVQPYAAYSPGGHAKVTSSIVLEKMTTNDLLIYTILHDVREAIKHGPLATHTSCLITSEPLRDR